MAKFLLTNQLDRRDSVGGALLGAAGIKPEYVRRLVLDLEVGSVGRMYVELFADDAALNVSIEPGGIEVRPAEEAA